MRTDAGRSHLAPPLNAPVLVIAAAAILIGIFARFSGLGAAPLAVDEYYLLRSADNILRHGWPQYDCGGWYTRGLLLQYLIAALRYVGASAEVAPRLICALSSLIALPAAYWLGRRIHSPAVGLLAVAILSISVWEIEMARFARMYAPFQALFLWYVVFFIRYTVDGERRAFNWMLALTLLSALVWEGAVFLALANFLPILLQAPAGRLPTISPGRVLALVALLAVVFMFATNDLRFTSDPAFPDSYEPSLKRSEMNPLETIKAPLERLFEQPQWLGWLVLPLLALAFTARWLWRWRGRPLAALGLAGILIACLLHQFLAAGALLLVLTLLQWVRWRELSWGDARPFHIAIICSVVFWAAFAISTTDLNAAGLGDPLRGVLVALYQYMSFPNVVDIVVRPWSQIVPVLGAGLLLAIAVLSLRASLERSSGAERVALIVLVCLLLAVGLSNPPRQETRYVFYLYPLAMILALAGIAQLIARVRGSTAGAYGTSLMIWLVGLGSFALTEDFRPMHLMKIDSPEAIFGTSARFSSHLVVRHDSRRIARWLAQHATSEDMVISGYHSLEYYYPRIAHFFVDWRDRNFTELSCQRGSIDRWSNAPLLYTTDALRELLTEERKLFIVVFADRAKRLLSELADWGPQEALAGDQDTVSVIVVQGS